MKIKYTYIILLLLCIGMVGCKTKKTAVSHPTSEPTWHTCLIQGARATIETDGNKLSAAVTMQTVRDSMLVISIMPMLGMEMLRLEATPLEITGINKLEGVYATATFAELNRKIVPSVNWDVLQQLCAAELPMGSEKARLVYTLGEQRIELTVTYPARQLDVPVRVMHQNVSRYEKVEIQQYFAR